MLMMDGFRDVIYGVDDLNVEVESLKDFVIKEYKLIEKQITPLLVCQNSVELLIIVLHLRTTTLSVLSIVERYESSLR